VGDDDQGHPSGVELPEQATVADYGKLGVALPDLSFDATDPNVYGTQESVLNPLTSGVTPGEAYIPGTRAATIDSGGTCVDVKSISGGSIGYRLLDAQPSTDENMSAWVSQLGSLASSGKVPQEVADTAGDIYSTFFRAWNGGIEGSLYNFAPPIWQNLSMAFCADGSVKSTQASADSDDTPQTGLVYQSYMPDLYLYLDGHMVDQAGQPTSKPVQYGNFKNFSNIPGVTATKGQAYGICSIDDRGNAGNPWDIEVPPTTSTGWVPKTAIYCDDLTAIE
jgi:hypothetical protein